MNFVTEVNYVHIYMLLKEASTCDYVNMCATDYKFNADTICSDVND